MINCTAPEVQEYNNKEDNNVDDQNKASKKTKKKMKIKTRHASAAAKGQQEASSEEFNYNSVQFTNLMYSKKCSCGVRNEYEI